MSFQILSKELCDQGFSQEKTRETFNLMITGPPNSERKALWLALTGAGALISENSGYYSRLLNSKKMIETLSTLQIDKDINRTFSQERFFINKENILKLRNVLVAYSFRNESIGYCQGMNFIVARLLGLGYNEEETFWIFVQIMEKYMPFDYYTDMTGLIVDLKVFSLLIKSHLGKVAEHLEKINVDPVLFAVQWFLCVFSYNLPVESVIRVWDVFFSEGYVFLFRLGLAVLRIFRKKIFSYQNFHFAVEYLGSMSNGLRDVDLLLETANRFQVRLEDVLSLRKEFAGNPLFPSDLNLNCKNEKECKYLQGLTSDYFTFISFHQINYDENYFDQCSVRRSHCLLNFFSTDDIVVGCKNHNCLKEVPKKRLSKLFEKVFPNQAKIVMPRITLSPFFLISYVKEIIEVESLN